jgi:hypothetical protein
MPQRSRDRKAFWPLTMTPMVMKSLLANSAADGHSRLTSSAAASTAAARLRQPVPDEAPGGRNALSCHRG